MSNLNLDDDGRPKRSGNVWTASAFIITIALASGIASSSWAMSQLGWIAAPALILLCSYFAYFTSTVLAACYWSGDPVARNYTYMDAVTSANHGGFQAALCGATQYLDLCVAAISYTAAESANLMAFHRSICFQSRGVDSPCKASTIPYMIAFGTVEILLSQIPNFGQIWWLAVVSAIMCLISSAIGVGLSIAKIAEAGVVQGSLTGMSTASLTLAQKIFRSFQAIGSIVYGFSYFLIFIEVQDTINSPPSQNEGLMKRATFLSLAVTTIFNMLCGCLGYAAFGDMAPQNFLTAFGFYNPYWLVDIARAAIVIHHIGAYQVCCQPIFAFVEKTASKWFPNSDFINQDIRIRIPGFKTNWKLNLFKTAWRSIFVIITTGVPMLLPFVNEAVGVLGVLGLWRLAVYFPVTIYISQKEIQEWSQKWISLKILSLSFLVISIGAAVGSFTLVVTHNKG